MISQSYIDGLTKQAFIVDYMLNGMFPCRSDIVKSIRGKKRDWKFTDRFEYRMLLATTNTGGTLNSAIFNQNVSLRKPNESTIGVFKATYGTVSDGFDVDMTVNLETKESKTNFLNKYSLDVHGMRMNVASLFKNFAINGRFGVLWRIREQGVAPGSNISIGTPVVGTPFTVVCPKNVFHSGFKAGRYLIKTTGTGNADQNLNGDRPWGTANVNELYMVVDNQPNRLTLIAVPGSTPTPWVAGQFLEVFGNRTIASGGSFNWVGGGITLANGVNTGAIDASGTYTAGAMAGTGAMEGLSDLFPWYIDAANNRLGLDLPFRDQPNRQTFSAEMAGHFYTREANEEIIDAIMNGVAIAAAAIPAENVGVWMNPDTMTAIGYQQGDNVRLLKDLASSQPLIFQQGVTSHDYQIGSYQVKQALLDYNLPTDVVIIGPKDDLSYNSWDNAYFEIDRYTLDTFSKTKEPKPADINLPKDFVTRLDLSSRITYGSPVLGDHAITTGNIAGGQFVHPSNRLPIAFHEMGALFTEAPHAYVVINLRNELLKPTDVLQWTD